MSNKYSVLSNTGNDEKTEKKANRKITIAGDSLVKNLHGWKMSKSNVKVGVQSFSGCSTEDMACNIQPVLRREPDEVILHVGTNSLQKHTTAHACAKEIIVLAKSIDETTQVTISSLITRSDKADMTTKIKEVNRFLKSSCHQNNWNFIDNGNITAEHLNGSKLHLSKTGTTILAKNILSYINAH